MPGSDSQANADQVLGTALAEGPGAGSDEGLANALSAFLAQLHTGFDDEAPGEGARVPDLSPASSISRLAPTSPARTDSRAAARQGSGPLPHRMNSGARTQATKTVSPPGRLMGNGLPTTAVTAPASAPAPAPAPAPLVAGPGKEPRTGRVRRGLSGHRPGTRSLVAAVTVALVAGLSGAIAWGSGQASQLGRASAQLSATGSQLAQARASLAQARASAGAAQGRAGRRLADIQALDHELTTTRVQLAKVGTELATTTGRLLAAQAQVGQAHGQVGQAQGQLGSTQHNLVITQAHAAQCQQGAQLGQESLQVFGSLVLLQTDYLTASQSGDRAQMRHDLARMRSLESQAQTIGPKFAGSVALCTHN